ncbi:MAG: hypothetical protein NTV70_14665 [Acidobacteria bacterium]|nr:hypothetical protein [Acidobacteriota bacterium]
MKKIGHMSSLGRICSLFTLGVAYSAASWAGSIAYTDFSSVAGLQLNGSASKSGNTLRLTPASYYQGGSAFSTSPVALSSAGSFSTYFQFRIGNNGSFGDSDGPGADGLAFVLQSQANTAGSAGGGIGYGGLSPSLAIEFDTFWNGGDPNGNHVGINVNGDLQSVASKTEATRFNDGDSWHAWVDYNGASGLLEVRWSQTKTRPVASMLTNSVNLTSVFGGSPNVFAGFTAATGLGVSEHDILSWEFRDDFRPISSVPEPGTSLVAAAILGGLFWRRAGGRR